VPEAAVELLALRKQAAIVEARLGASVLTAEFRAQHDAFTVIRGARRLGVAQRTVERRMQRILKALDATTRFQAGLRAGQRGLLV
jgi:hypothetical protein